MRDFLRDPPCTADTVGQPLPDSPHAVSVSLPTWRSVIGYEEKEPEVVDRMRLGYPRFVLHPQVVRLFEEARRRHGAPGEDVLVFPGPAGAARARMFLGRRGISSREVGMDQALAALFFPAAHAATARLYWRFSGEIVSSRQAEHFFGPSDPAGGEAARQALRHHLASLSGQDPEDVHLYPSGMAATFFMHQALGRVSPGRPTAQVDFPYVDVLRVQREFGNSCAYFPVIDRGMESWCFANRPFGIFAEMPSNPLLRCVDPEALARLCRDVESPLVLDDTIASVVNVDAFKHADAVTTSLTKWVSGRGDVMAGALILRSDSPWRVALSDALRELAPPALWDGDAVVLEANAADFPDRMVRVNETARLIAGHLQRHSAVQRLWYPEWECRAAYDAIRRPGGGFGGLMSLVLEGGEARSAAFFDALQLAKGPSLGTDFSLACPYTLLAHYDELPWAASCGVPRDLIRLSIGLEEPEDLIARLEKAFHAAG
jgi:cystathionine gamma-synthase